MKKSMYNVILNYMFECMNDSAHDPEHIFRVLYLSLNIASKRTEKINYNVLIASCLLHDIGREEQFKNHKICHAEIGGTMANNFLVKNGWKKEEANHVNKCISSHRFRGNNVPETIEAKILFDADKIDVSGVMGISRTILYKGQTNEPLYYVNSEEQVIYENGDSFIQEYNYKLKNIYDKFYTNRGNEIAKQRQKAAVNFYNCMLDEIETTYKQGRMNLNNALL